MGLFSFLNGNNKSEAAPATDRAVVEQPRSADAPAPVEEPAPRTESSPETPFTPPEAWNLDALLAPPPEPSGEKSEVGPIDRAITAELQPHIVDALKTVYDPEIPVDIYELGLIYDIIADSERRVLISMTLTSPACPSAQQIPSEVRYKVKAIPGVSDAWVDIVWEPPWDKDRMSEAAKLTLGFL